MLPAARSVASEVRGKIPRPSDVLGLVIHLGYHSNICSFLVSIPV
jgi:hypothetical protein